jgi:hypothetical protein
MATTEQSQHPYPAADAKFLAQHRDHLAPEWPQRPVRFVRINSLKWSPVTESNRRPSPYHVPPSGLIAPDTATDQHACWHTQAETSSNQHRRAPFCPSKCPSGSPLSVPLLRLLANPQPVRAQSPKYTLKCENTGSRRGANTCRRFIR